MKLIKKLYYFFRYWRDDIGFYDGEIMLITAKEAWELANIFTRNERISL